MEAIARKSPDYLSGSVIYQMFLRSFTSAGTIKAGTDMLPFLADLGIDIIYLCPVTLQDDDMRTEFWSARQKECDFGNPCNPYRVKDYFAVDPEYGTEADLKKFVECAHELGMRVLFDLVYYHCGPSAPLIGEHPDWVRRDDAGNVLGEWNFPELNFDSDELCEYLWSNMEYFVTELDVDGYRCDVGDRVRLSFWEEGRRRIETLKPDCIMLCEGFTNPDDQLFAFDVNYCKRWEHGVIDLFKGDNTAEHLIYDCWKVSRDFHPEGARLLRGIDNHDTANDCFENRHELTFGADGVEAALFLNLMMDGIPFLYNGTEIADTARHSIYANRFYGHNLHIDWSRALTKAGKARREFRKKVIALRHSCKALSEGSVEWIKHDQPEDLLILSKTCDDQRLLVLVNSSREPLLASFSFNSDFDNYTFLINKEVMLHREDDRIFVDIASRGYALLEY